MILRSAPALALAATLAATTAAAEDPVRYALRYSDEAPGRLSVEIRPGRAALPATLVMPRAIPMGYGEQPFDDFVSDVVARGPDGAPLTVTRGEGPRWHVVGPGPLDAIRYEVDLARLEDEIHSAADASKARSGYVGLLGYSVLAFLEGHETRPARLEVEAPAGWTVFPTLAPAVPPAIGRASAETSDYYALADSQVLMGPDLEVRRVDGSPPLFVAAYAESELAVDRVGAVGREALDALVAWFGSAPFPHYTIVVEVLRPVSPDHEYGFSMEHLDSGTFFLDERGALTERSDERQRRRTLYNYAHHVAHSWIPKRSYGEGYFPFSWEKAPILDTIWLSEGFGQYAAALALAESMGDSGAGWLESLVQYRFQETLDEAPDFIRAMDTVELSRVASTRYSEDFRTGAGSFSRGAMMAREMDAAIRSATGGRRSLKHALRHLVAWSAREKRPFALHELPGLLSEGAGVDIGDVYERWMAAPVR